MISAMNNTLRSHATWIVVVSSCFLAWAGAPEKSSAQQRPDWDRIKARTRLEVDHKDKYGEPFRLPLACGGWEDGLYITRDGRRLYCIYFPADLFAFFFEGKGDISHFAAYRRGPTFGMDMKTNPIGAPMWLHGDILHATRPNVAEPFGRWRLSRLARPVWSEGAVCLIMKDGKADWFVYTSNHRLPNDDDNIDLMMIRNCSLDPATRGKVFPPPVTTDHVEDNPHIERLGPKELVLFFDSNRPGGRGGLDLWFTTSGDDGRTWTRPRPVTSLNTRHDEQMPHLFQDDSGKWWLYYMGTDAVTQRSGIYRCRLRARGDWSTWSTPQRVIGPGNAFAVGEPTLTKWGDIAFVVIEKAPDAPPTDRYDCDPWILPRKGSPIDLLPNSARSNTRF